MAFSLVLLEFTDDKALTLQIPSGLTPHLQWGVLLYGKAECGSGTKPNTEWGCEHVTSAIPAVFSIKFDTRNYAIELPQVRFVLEHNRIKGLTESKRRKAKRNLPLITSE